MTQEALKLALYYLEQSDNYLGSLDHSKPIAAIKEALAQPEQEQEPVAHWSDCAVHNEPAYPKGECDCGGFATPPQRTWVGLTAGEILDTLISVDEKTVRLPSMLGQFACAIEAKLKEKNT